jgi:hypothetical protein
LCVYFSPLLNSHVQTYKIFYYETEGVYA